MTKYVCKECDYSEWCERLRIGTSWKELPLYEKIEDCETRKAYQQAEAYARADTFRKECLEEGGGI